MTLTTSQEGAVAAFREFLKSENQVFMLQGAAGTGKTTVVLEFIKILKQSDRKFGLMTPTGRAAHILSTKTGQFASTIHRRIYAVSAPVASQKENDPEQEEAPLHAYYDLKHNEDVDSTVYIVDESSMVSDLLSKNETFSFGSGRDDGRWSAVSLEPKN